MNNKLIAMAIASAFVLPVAAQAETTLYGQFNLSYDSMKLGTDTATTSANYNGLVSNNSRLGVKGLEPLGGGLNAIYQVESGFAAATGANAASWGTLAARNTFAGFNNKTFGTFWAGRMDTPYKRATGAWDFFNETIGDANDVISHPEISTAGAKTVYGPGFHQRLNRSVGYDGAWNGLYVDLQAGSAKTQGDPSAGAGMASGTPKFGTISGLIGYRVAGWDINYSAERNKFQTGVGTAFTSARAQALGVGYTLPAQFMGAQLGAVYEKIDSDATATATDNWSKRNWWVGAAVPFLGHNKFGISYGHAGSSAINGSASNGAKQVAIGASHNFTKNTSVYAVYAHLKNDAGGGYELGTDHGDVSDAYKPVGGTGQTLKGLSIGLLTKF